MKNIIEINKEILGGIPVFKGTRVPVKNLWDYLERGESIEQFLTGFPSVRREQVIRLLKEAERLTISKKQKYENIT